MGSGPPPPPPLKNTKKGFLALEMSGIPCNDMCGMFMCRSRGGAGGLDPPPPLKNHKKGFFSNTGPNPLKNHKATKPVLNPAIIGPPGKRHLNGVSLAGQ